MKNQTLQENNLAAELQQLRQTLRQVREESLLATRQGDFRKVAKLTTQAASLNKAILETEGLLDR